VTLLLRYSNNNYSPEHLPSNRSSSHIAEAQAGPPQGPSVAHTAIAFCCSGGVACVAKDARAAVAKFHVLYTRTTLKLPVSIQTMSQNNPATLPIRLAGTR
jgi:hypothetical protein